MTQGASKQDMTVKISFNGKSIGHMWVEWITLNDESICTCKDHHDHDNDQTVYAEGETYYRELFVIDSDRIIECNSKDHRNLAELKFEVKDNLFRYDLLDSDENIVQMTMIPMTYVHTINASADGPPKERVTMNRYSRSEKERNR